MTLPATQEMARTLSIFSVKEFEKAYMRSGYYIGPGGFCIEGKRERATAFMEDMLSVGKEGGIEAPTILVYDKPDGSIAARFTDGRHRYYVLRDAGATEIAMATTSKGQQIAIEHGMVSKFFVMRM